MPRLKKEETPMEVQSDSKRADDLRDAMLEVGCKLCDDILNGKARDEKTALSAIVEIYEAVHVI